MSEAGQDEALRLTIEFADEADRLNPPDAQRETVRCVRILPGGERIGAVLPWKSVCGGIPSEAEQQTELGNRLRAFLMALRYPITDRLSHQSVTITSRDRPILNLPWECVDEMPGDGQVPQVSWHRCWLSQSALTGAVPMAAFVIFGGGTEDAGSAVALQTAIESTSRTARAVPFSMAHRSPDTLILGVLNSPAMVAVHVVTEVRSSSEGKMVLSLGGGHTPSTWTPKLPVSLGHAFQTIAGSVVVLVLHIQATPEVFCMATWHEVQAQLVGQVEDLGICTTVVHLTTAGLHEVGLFASAFYKTPVASAEPVSRAFERVQWVFSTGCRNSYAAPLLRLYCTKRSSQVDENRKDWIADPVVDLAEPLSQATEGEGSKGWVPVGAAMIVLGGIAIGMGIGLSGKQPDRVWLSAPQSDASVDACAKSAQWRPTDGGLWASHPAMDVARCLRPAEQWQQANVTSITLGGQQDLIERAAIWLERRAGDVSSPPSIGEAAMVRAVQQLDRLVTSGRAASDPTPQAGTLLLLGYPGLAQALCDEAADLQWARADVMFLQAMARRRVDLTSWEDDLQRILYEAPAHIPALDAYACALIANNKAHKEAERLLRLALLSATENSNGPNTLAQLHRHLAEVLDQGDQKGRAEQEKDRAKQLEAGRGEMPSCAQAYPLPPEPRKGGSGGL